MVSRKLLMRNPGSVGGLVRALNRAFVEIAADPDAAIDLIVKQEPLLTPAIERQRLVYAFKTHFLSPETATLGVGDINDSRMQKAIKMIVNSYQLPNTPAAADVFDRSFLPPKEARMPKLKM